MANRVQGSPLVHSALSMRRRSAYSAAKSFPTAAAPLWINVMSSADEPLLKQTGPDLEGPATAPAPPGSDSSANGGLRRDPPPRGLLTTEQAPEDSPPFSPLSLSVIPSLSLNHFSIHMPVLTSAS